MRTGAYSAFVGVVLTVMGLACSASAEEARPYMSVSGVYVLSAESDVKNLFLQGDSGTVDADSTIGVVGAVGMDWGRGWQTELEVGYRSMDLSRLSGTIPGVVSGSVDANGAIKTITIMSNVRYVLKPEQVFNESWGGIHPYIGFGLGVALHEAELDVTILSNRVNLEGDDTVFAYQGLVGLSYDFTDAVGSQIGYRYLGTSEFEDQSTTATYQTHGFEFGVSYRF